MIDDLLRDGCCLEPGLFVEDGVEEEVRVIRDAINSGASFGPHSAHSMVEVTTIRGKVVYPCLVVGRRDPDLFTCYLIGRSGHESRRRTNSRSGKRIGTVGIEALHRTIVTVAPFPQALC